MAMAAPAATPDATLFAVDVLGLAEGATLVLKTECVANHAATRAALGLAGTTVDALTRTCAAIMLRSPPGEAGQVDASARVTVVDLLASLPAEPTPGITQAVHTLFHMLAFTPSPSGEGDPLDASNASLADVVTALSVLCDGSKSDKLAHAWSMYASASDDAGEVVGMTRRGLWRLLRAVLLGLAWAAQPLHADAHDSVHDSSVSGAAISLSSMDTHTCEDVAAACTAACFNHGRAHAVMDIHTFAFVYTHTHTRNGGAGQAHMAWLELWSTHKWPRLDAAAPAAVPAPVQPQQAVPVSPSVVVYDVSLTSSHDVRLVVTTDTLQTWAHLASHPFMALTLADTLQCVLAFSAVCEAARAPGSPPYTCAAAAADLTRVCASSKVDAPAPSETPHPFLVSLLAALSEAEAEADAASTTFTASWLDVCMCALVFARTHKSDKLQVAWTLMEERGDAVVVPALTRRCVWRCMYAFLLTLQCIATYARGDAMSALGTDVLTIVRDTVAAAALDATACIFVGCDRADETLVTLEDVCIYYNEAGGSDTLSWLELLSPHKWQAMLQAQQQPQAATASAPQQDAAAPLEGEPEPPALPPVQDEQARSRIRAKGSMLAVACAGSTILFKLDSALSLPTTAVPIMHLLCQATGMHEHSADHMVATMQQLMGENTQLHSRSISRSEWRTYLRALIPAQALSQVQRRGLTHALMRLHAHLRAGACTSAWEAVIALTLCAGGSKSTKIAAIWECVQPNTLSRSHARRFMRAMLHTLLWLQSEAVRVDASRTRTPVTSLPFSDVHTHVCATAAGAVDAISQDGERMITWDSFTTWYNAHGYTYASWMELYTHTHWHDDARALPAADMEAITHLLAGDVVVERHDDGSDEEEEDESAQEVFLILSVGGVALRITQASARARGLVCAATGMDRCSAARMCSVLRDADVTDASSIAAAIARACDVPQIAAHDGFARVCMHAATHAPAPAPVRVVLLAAALCCTAGSKSDKLEALWSAIEPVSAGDVATVMYACACTHTLLHAHAVANSVPPAAAYDACMEAAQRIAQDVLQGGGDGEAGSYVISYARFAQWYNARGHVLAPFLELLDARKWARVAAAPEEAMAEPAAQADQQEEELQDDDEHEHAVAPPSYPLIHAELFDTWAPALTQVDVTRFMTFVECVPDMTYEHILKSVAAQARSDGTVTRGAVLKQLLPAIASVFGSRTGDASVDAARVFASTYAMRAFDVLVDGSADAAEDETADALCLCAWLCIYVPNGSKSECIRLFWDMFSRTHAPADAAADVSTLVLNQHVFESTMETLLLACVCGCADAWARVDDARAWVRECVVALTRASGLFETPDAEVTFQAFTQWYNGSSAAGAGGSGYSLAPFLELLSVRGWTRLSASVDAGAQPVTATVPRATAAVPPAPPQAAAPPAPVPQQQSSDDDDEGKKDAVVYTFDSEDTGDAMCVTREDVAAFTHILYVTGSIDSAARSLMDRVYAHTLTHLHTHAFADALVPVHSRDYALTHAVLTHIHEALIHVCDTSDAHLHACVCACAASIFASGHKSVKLKSAFHTFSHDATLSYKQCEMLLHSLLTVLLTLTHAVPGDSDRHVPEAVLAQSWVRALIRRVHEHLEGADAQYDAAHTLTYDAFARFYNDAGHRICAWLELLDASKWSLVHRSAAADDTADVEHAQADDNGGVDGDGDKLQPPQPAGDETVDDIDGDTAGAGGGSNGRVSDDAGQLSFALSVGTLTFTSEDRSYLTRVCELTQLHTRSCADVHAALCAAYGQAHEALGHAPTGLDASTRVNERTFRACMRALIPPHASEDALEVTAALTRVFYTLTYTHTRSHEAALRDISAALTLLCTGSVEEKLVHVLRLYAPSGDASLPPETLAHVLRVWMHTLAACRSPNHIACESASEAATLERMDEHIQAVCSSIASASSSTVTVDAVITWLRAQARQEAPWMSMWDQRVWMLAPPPAVNEQGDAPAPAAASLTLQLPASHTLTVTPRDCVYVTTLAHACGMSAHSLAQVVERLTGGGVETKYISADVFHDRIRGLMNAPTATHARMAAIMAACVWTCVSAHSGGGGCVDATGGVSAICLANTMCVLTHGSKSIKLHACMRAASGAASMQADALRHTLGHVCEGIFIATAMGGSWSTEHIHEVAAACARAIVDGVASGMSSDAGDGFTFNDVTQWYNAGGYKVCPFLELLDTRKWALRESGGE